MIAESDREDLALETLLTVAHEVAPGIPDELIRAVYAIELVHQFEAGSDREAAIQGLLRMLEEQIANAQSERGDVP